MEVDTLWHYFHEVITHTLKLILIVNMKSIRKLERCSVSCQILRMYVYKSHIMGLMLLELLDWLSLLPPFLGGAMYIMEPGSFHCHACSLVPEATIQAMPSSTSVHFGLTPCNHGSVLTNIYCILARAKFVGYTNYYDNEKPDKELYSND